LTQTNSIWRAETAVAESATDIAALGSVTPVAGTASP
jgi:hypothetical protein